MPCDWQGTIPAAKSRTRNSSELSRLLCHADYRIANQIHQLGVKTHSKDDYWDCHSGQEFDIHPKQVWSVCSDHGTGGLIGETLWSVITVRFTQGVRSSAFECEKAKRIQATSTDRGRWVVIYAVRTIWRYNTIGKIVWIGRNVMAYQNVPAGKHSVLPSSNVSCSFS